MATKEETLALDRPQQDGELAPRPLTIEDLMSQAINTGNVEVMKETFKMWMTLKSETARETYNKQLKAFQAACPPIKKEKVVKNSNQTTRYKYAPLESVIKIAGGPLSDHGFSWDFDSKLSDRGQELLCTLRHENGHSETRSATAPIDAAAAMNVDQQHGSAESYAKRRAFLNVTGLVPEGEDTDAITPAEARSNGGKDHRFVNQPKEKPSTRKESPTERFQIEPIGEGDKGIDKATATSFMSAITRGFASYGDQAKDVGWSEFKKRFPKIDKLSQIPNTPAAQRILLDWIADPVNK